MEWLKSVACAVALTIAVGTGAVVAAAEALEPTSGSAVVLLCGAVGRCRDVAHPPMASAPEDATPSTPVRPGR
ncbi:hypothetical protein QTI33_15105 [Variovorax sp. J22P271]|uniref:hypothetical protein n=1 Tax=Variovorax davisae TaxID=3053515 RepID=UPI002577A923|nr:hypothetical protein [Variovorax sp. J22P271]MDM0033462.1 hypothetical protein [Variovorax sp. J22P271]